LIRDDGSPQNITDGAGNVFSYIYDNTTTLFSASKFPDGSKETFGYDAQGNLKKKNHKKWQGYHFRKWSGWKNGKKVQ
jgi:hypothetical protein